MKSDNNNEYAMNGWISTDSKIRNPNCQLFSWRNCGTRTLHSAASERSIIRKLFKLGYIQYAVLAKEDIQWCDWLLWNKQTSKWSQIELKSNNDISLFDSNGDFLRLGTLSTKRELNRYLSKGIRIQKIAKILGFGDTYLLYSGKICPNAKNSLYKLDFDENGIQKYTEIINEI